MKNIFFIFPIHLFQNINNLKKYDTLYLIEEPRYFTDFNFHKLKLAYHRATMKHYFDFLKKKNLNVKYVDFSDVTNSFYSSFSKDTIDCYDPNDHLLEEKLLKYKCNILPSLNFLLHRSEIHDNLDIFFNKKNKKFNFMNFYKFMRRKENILITKNDQPVGGKWSFDEDNRKPYPKNGPKIPDLPSIKSNNPYIVESISYVEKHFSKNYGSLEHFIYPIDHISAKNWCIDFCKKKFKLFGIYEDAILDNNNFLFHSVLSPMMNIGLITDREVLEIVLKFEKKVPISAFEGFIRQVIGWRNYVYTVYDSKYGNIDMKTSEFYKMTSKMNFMKHKNKLPYKHFWEGTTNIYPVDNAIQNLRNLIDINPADMPPPPPPAGQRFSPPVGGRRPRKHRGGYTYRKTRTPSRRTKTRKTRK